MASSTILHSFIPVFTPPKSKASPSNLSMPSFLSRNRDRLSPISASSEGNQYPELPSDLMSVVNPSLAHANTLFFKSGYNVQIDVEEDESDESVLNRFRREVMRAGIIQECKRRRYFENKQEKKKRKARDAARRNRRRRTPFVRQEDPVEISEKKDEDDEEYDDDDDNWELPAGGLPF